MKKNKVLRTNLSILALAGILTACSHSPEIQEFPNTASAQDEIIRLETELDLAAKNDVNVLAPENFENAHRSLQNAKKSMENQNDAKSTLHKVAKGRSYLSSANKFAQISHEHIEDVVVARRQAIAAGAQSSQDKDFRTTDENLVSVTREIEENNLSDAMEKRSALQLAYLNLELKAIKQTRLGKSLEIIHQASNEGAEKYAPQSFAIAEKSVQDTDAFITANRHDTMQIDARSKETLKKSNHLLKITRDSKSGKKISSEDQALKIENEQIKVATKQEQLVKGQMENQALTEANSNLEDEQALNLRYEEARTEFSKSEAEVYKQGNSLMIRLRGLNFPVAHATLNGSNFPLLAKVQKVIKTFGKSTVVVEGHTDSNGGKSLNDKLSSDRAEAVREYLSSNNTSGQTLNIKAIGYGYQKPLATNKTANGRAQNRRVDVLIQPDNGTSTSNQ